MYRIIRFHRTDRHKNYVVKTGLTLEEAQAHCQDPETSSLTCSPENRGDINEDWFDGYEETNKGWKKPSLLMQLAILQTGNDRAISEVRNNKRVRLTYVSTDFERVR